MWLVRSHYILTAASPCLSTLWSVLTIIHQDSMIVIPSSCTKSYRGPLNKGTCNVLTNSFNSNCVHSSNCSSNYNYSTDSALYLSTVVTLHHKKRFKLPHLNKIKISAIFNTLKSNTVINSRCILLLPKHLSFKSQVESQDVYVYIITVIKQNGFQRH